MAAKKLSRIVRTERRRMLDRLRRRVHHRLDFTTVEERRRSVEYLPTIELFALRERIQQLAEASK